MPGPKRLRKLNRRRVVHKSTGGSSQGPHRLWTLWQPTATAAFQYSCSPTGRLCGRPPLP